MEATYDDLVRQLEQVEGKHETILALRAGGEDAKPALLRGMTHPAWRVRHGCLRVLDHTIIDDPTRRVVFDALGDPHRKVRMAALHVLGCEVCKPEGYCGIEGVDLEATYLDIARNDRSGRVQRSAMGRFRWRRHLDADVDEAMRAVLTSPTASASARRQAAAVLTFPEIVALTDTRPNERHARFEASVESLLEATS